MRATSKHDNKSNDDHTAVNKSLWFQMNLCYQIVVRTQSKQLSESNVKRIAVNKTACERSLSMSAHRITITLSTNRPDVHRAAANNPACEHGPNMSANLMSNELLLTNQCANKVQA